MSNSETRKEAEALWAEVEHVGDHWQQSMRTDFPVIPISVLRRYWDAVTGKANPRDQLRMDSAAMENVLLKREVQELRAQMERATKPVAYRGVERRQSRQ